MIIKNDFVLLKGTRNIFSESLEKYKLDNGQRKVFVTLKLIEDRINHFTKDRVISFVSNLSRIKDPLKEEVVNLSDYLLPGSYNFKTNASVINIKSDDISKLDPKMLYANIVYSLSFSWCVSKRVKIPDNYAPIITSFLLGIFMRLFGKDYGLLGTYSSKINQLKFLLSLYINSSFFGIDTKQNYKRSTMIASFSFPEDEISKFDFMSINDFIKSLSYFKIMPGINKYFFTAKFLRMFGFIFLPALEDVSRFISTITTSTLKGTNVVPTFISKYNEIEYSKLVELSKIMFRKA